MLNSENDLARIMGEYFPDGYVPLYFVQELMTFVKSNFTTHSDRWASFTPKDILKMASQSILKMKSVCKKTHCERYNPYCEGCVDFISAIVVSPKPCACFHRDLPMFLGQVYMSKNDKMSDRVIRPIHVEQLRDAVDSPERHYQHMLDPDQCLVSGVPFFGDSFRAVFGPRPAVFSTPVSQVGHYPPDVRDAIAVMTAGSNADPLEGVVNSDRIARMMHYGEDEV